MDTIKAVLDNLFKDQRVDHTLKGYRIFQMWEKAVGPRIARHCQPRRFHDQVLWITVDNSTWMQELKFLEGKIKDQINQQAGSAVVGKIRYQLGEIKAASYGITNEKTSPQWCDMELDDSVGEVIEKEVATLKDEGLKARLRSLFQKHAQLETYRSRK